MIGRNFAMDAINDADRAEEECDAHHGVAGLKIIPREMFREAP